MDGEEALMYNIIRQLKIAFYSFWPMHISKNAIITIALLVVLFSILMAVFRKKIEKPHMLVMLFFYACFLLEFTVFDRPILDSREVKWLLFWSYKEAFANNSFYYIYGNILNVCLFIPFGILISAIKKMPNVINVGGISVVSSAVIEVLQFCTWKGLFEFDDIVHNTIGAVGGYILYCTISAARGKKFNSTNKI